MALSNCDTPTMSHPKSCLVIAIEKGSNDRNTASNDGRGSLIHAGIPHVSASDEQEESPEFLARSISKLYQNRISNDEVCTHCYSFNKFQHQQAHRSRLRILRA
jgi:hypothetical protein